MRIATWNINSINQRTTNLVAWLKDREPDVVCLQEIKCVDANFPAEPFESLGYNVAVAGQKAFNGVALLSKLPLEDVTRGLPGDPADEQARFIAATVSTPTGAARIASIYLPNGNPINTDKYSYKIKWMDRLFEYCSEQLAHEEPLIVAGDYNVIPMPIDARFPEAWVNDALFLPETRNRYRALANLGFIDAVRAVSKEPGIYTFWDYQAGAWQKNNGIRIDHLLLSPQASSRLSAAGVDKHVRAWEKPSDHVPVWIDLDFLKESVSYAGR